MTLNSVTDEDALLRGAVFTSATVSGDYTLKAVLAANNGADTAYGTVTANADVSTFCTTPVDATTSYTITNLAPETKLYFKVVAWLDGIVLDDSTAGGSAVVGLKFQA